MKIPAGLYYTEEHEWVKIDGNKARIGISDHAQSALGDITYVELPKPGTPIQQFKSMASVESVKAASDVYAPLSGIVSRVNDELASKPELINQSPYEGGWFVEIDIKDTEEIKNLMKSVDYESYLKGAL